MDTNENNSKPIHFDVIWYFDFGNGYIERDSVVEKTKITEDAAWNYLEFSVDVPEGCVRLRFDPCNLACAVWGITFKDQSTNPIDDFTSNAMKMRGFDVFLTDDPQYEFILKKTNQKMRIDVNYRLRIISDNFVVELFNDYRGAHNKGSKRKRMGFLTSRAKKNAAPGIVESKEVSETEKLLEQLYTPPKNFEKFVDYKEYNFETNDESIKLVAFYLPQFHAIPENDRWWGKGFTEWTNVTKSIPLFTGHYQPQLPIDVGFYDLSTIEPMRRQVELAKNYGLYGFCFHYYWFGGKRLLEKPLENYFSHPDDLQFPFCVCWANENWSRRWDGSEDEVLISQAYSIEDDKACIADISRYFSDDRYIRIEGKPVVMIYRGELLTDCKKTIETWREYCFQNGIGEIHVVGALPGDKETLLGYGFDKLVEFPPNNTLQDMKYFVKKNLLDVIDSEHFIYDMHDFINRLDEFVVPEKDVYKCVFPSWDNSARRANHASIFQLSIDNYAIWLKKSIQVTKETQAPSNRLLFVNAWNEWAEGAHLEPDMRYGYAYLDTTAQVLSEELRQYKFSGDEKRIIFVGHDAERSGAQLLGLSFIKELKESLGYEVFVILKEGGPLLDAYRALSSDLLCIGQEHPSNSAFMQWIKNAGVTKAICNTIVTGDMVSLLAGRNVDCISLIHEMEQTIRQNHFDDLLDNIVKDAKKIVFASEYVRSSVDKIQRIPEEKVVIRSQGCYFGNEFLAHRAKDRIELRARHEIGENDKIVICTAYGTYRKGADLFAKCASIVCNNLENVYFIWVGPLDNKMNDEIKAMLAASSATSRFIVTGWIDDSSEFLKYYNMADIYLLTSREDPFPTVVMEAMVAGLPVVAFRDGGGYVELIDDDAGCLVTMEDVDAMSSCIIDLIQDDEKRMKMGHCAQKKVETHLNFREYVQDISTLAIACEAICPISSDKSYKKVSVVLPNYNYEKYLKDRIESILRQTYPIYELIILDDASTDNSTEVIKEYEKAYPQLIKSVLNEQNAGNVFVQWEKGLRYATGDFVWIAEADDLSKSNFLAEAMNRFEADEDIVLCYSQSLVIDENGEQIAENYLDYTNEIDPVIWKSDYISDGKLEVEERLSVKNAILNVSSVVFKNSDFGEALKHAKQYKVAGDWRFYVEVLQSGGKVSFISEPLNIHRRHSSSVTQDLNAVRHFEEICELQDYVYHLTSNQEYYKKALKYRNQVKEYLGV